MSNYCQKFMTFAADMEDGPCEDVAVGKLHGFWFCEFHLNQEMCIDDLLRASNEHN